MDDDGRVRLNLGCGRDIREGWVNVDRMDLPGVDVVWEMGTEPLPFPPDSVDGMLLSHVIEHLPDPLLVMEQLWTMAKADATLIVRCPHGASNDADEDPTHVRRMYPGSFVYFGQPAYHLADYGYRGDWQVKETSLWVREEVANYFGGEAKTIHAVKHYRNVVAELEVWLRAVKPRREVTAECDPIVATVKVQRG